MPIRNPKSEIRNPLRGLFITGTDTGVGKTFVTAAIARRLREQGVRVGACKPACSGSEEGESGPRWSDVETLAAAIGFEVPVDRICPQRFHAPLAPPVAARLEGREVDDDLLRRGVEWWRGRVDVLLVEGAGGLLSPLSERAAVADVARDVGFPLVIVARAGLGTINHTLLTLEAATARGLRVAGVILNQSTPAAGDVSVETNAAELAKRSAVPILATLPWLSAARLLQNESFLRMDWFALSESP